MPLNRLQKTLRSTCRFAAVAAIIRHRHNVVAEESLRRLRRPQSLAELALPQRAGALPAQVRILGLDPGSQRTGYAVVETQAGRVAYIVSGAIRTRGESLAERLQEIFAGVESLTQRVPAGRGRDRARVHAPERRQRAEARAGARRGAERDLAVRPRVFEYAPREVKLAVVGTGGAQKEQVQLMVKRLLNIAGPLTADAADALAIALVPRAFPAAARARVAGGGRGSMIGFLRGRLTAKQPPQLVIDVGGVGYEVEAPMSTFYDLPPTGSEITLFTHLVVREDAHILFGFAHRARAAPVPRAAQGVERRAEAGARAAVGHDRRQLPHVHRGAGRRRAGAHSGRRPQDRRAPAGRNARPGQGIRRAHGRDRRRQRNPAAPRSVHRPRRSARWSRSATGRPK